ncbi:MAG: hypothetical protein ACKOU6_02715 [Planctomycetota bacterium]
MKITRLPLQRLACSAFLSLIASASLRTALASSPALVSYTYASTISLADDAKAVPNPDAKAEENPPSPKNSSATGNSPNSVTRKSNSPTNLPT